MENFTPFSAAAGGVLIGISVSLLLLFNGRIAGISGILNGILYAPKNDTPWRVLFLAGLISGSFIFHLLLPDFNIPRVNYPLWLLLAGGFLVGFGGRLANGCISGHGVCGIARLSIRSITATAIFMGAGMATTYLIRHLFQLV
ncbi:MAG: YeeE/YedE family protein [Gammaproteobacteria bacterium]